MENKQIVYVLLFFPVFPVFMHRKNIMVWMLVFQIYYRLSDAKRRSISPENFNGEKGKGGMAKRTGSICCRDLGQGWKVSPSS